MAYGLDRRDGPASQEVKPLEQASIPLAPVQSPRFSSMSRVGENERLLGDALGKASAGISAYVDKKRPEWELEGQMAYAEGKTEQEIVEQGNRYTTAGYMTMKARTAGNSWMENALQEIENSDKTLDSAAYQKKLKDNFKMLTEGVAGNDTFTRNLMGSMASDMFPKLVSQQIKSNNTWREGEQGRSYTDLLVSEGNKFDPEDPEGKQQGEHLTELLQEGVSGLPKVQHRKAVSDAIKLGLENNNPRVAWALRGALGQPATGDKAETVLNHIIQNFEGTTLVANDAGAGKSIYGVNERANPDLFVNGKIPSFSEAKSALKTRYYDAIGADSLPDSMKLIATNHAINFGVDKAKTMIEQSKNNPATLVALGRSEHERLLKANPAKYGPYAEAWKNRDDALERSLNGLPAEAGQNPIDASTLLRSGFDAAETMSILKSYDSFMTRRSTEFDKERTITEHAIAVKAEAEGNLPAALDEIQTQMKAKGYSPAWGESMADKAIAAVNKYETEKGKVAELTAAAATNTIGLLPSEKAQKAFDGEFQRVSNLVAADQTLSPEQKEEKIKEGMFDVLAANPTAVYKRIAGTIESNLSGVILNKDGTVKPETLNAYNDYLDLSRRISPTYASKYLGDAKDLVALARVYDAGGLTSQQALQTAESVLSRKQNNPNYVAPSPTSKDIQTVSDKFIKDLDPDVFDSFSTLQASDFLDVRTSDIENYKSNPSLKAYVEYSYLNHKLAKPDLPDEAVMNLIKDELPGKVELAVGNVLISGDTPIKTAMNLDHINGKNIVDKAMLTFLKDRGSKMWPEHYNKFQFGANDPNIEGFFNRIGHWASGIPESVSASVDDKMRGVPAVHMTYDSDREGVIMDLYANKEKTVLLNAPIFVKLSDIGTRFNTKVTDALAAKQVKVKAGNAFQEKYMIGPMD